MTGLANACRRVRRRRCSGDVNQSNETYIATYFPKFVPLEFRSSAIERERGSGCCATIDAWRGADRSNFPRTPPPMGAHHAPRASARTSRQRNRRRSMLPRPGFSAFEWHSSGGRYTHDRNMRHAGSAANNPAGTARPARCMDQLAEARNERRSPSRVQTGLIR